MATSTGRAWAAGIIDGEGCISATRPEALNLVVKVTSVDRVIVSQLQTLFGGRIRKQGPYSPERRPYYVWWLQQVPATRFLQMIRPYLVLKGERADLFLQLAALVAGRVGQRRTPALRQQIYRLTHRMMRLNRRGSDTKTN